MSVTSDVTPIRHFASVGALLTTASLALETVVGSAIQVLSPCGPLPYLVAAPRTNRYQWALKQTTGQSLGDQLPIPVMISAIDTGLSESMNYGDIRAADLAILTPPCSTAHCDFGVYQTISVNYTCEDISSHMRNDSQSRFYYVPSNSGLPEDLYLNATSGLINSTVTLQYPDSSIFSRAEEIGPLIANVFIIANKVVGQKPAAVECALFWVVSTLQSNTTPIDGWTESLLKSETNFSSSARTAAINPVDKHSIFIEPEECWINGTLFMDHLRVTDPVDHQPECIHFVTPNAQIGLQNWLTNSKYGLGGMEISHGSSWDETNPFMIYLNFILDAAQNTSSFAGAIDKYVFHNLAAAMSRTIRQLPRGNLHELWDGAYVYWARGTMFEAMCFQVRWPVMVFPIVLLLGSAIFTFVVAKRAREHLWKRSNLPLLFHGLGTRERDSCGEIEDYVDMRAKAKDMKVRLSANADGQVRFVEVSSPTVLTDMENQTRFIPRKPVGSVEVRSFADSNEMENLTLFMPRKPVGSRR
jgi:hypothetical protein